MTRWLSLLLVAALGWFVPVEARPIPRAQPPVTTGYAQLLEEMSPASGNPKQFYVYGLNLTCQERNTGTPAAPNYELRYHAYDGLGSVRFLVQPGGTVNAADTYRYDAFGVLISPASALANNQYLFAGEQWDDDLKLYYLRARYYDPNLGRFLTSDTFEGNQSDPLSLHKYLYANGNPVNNIDPSGSTTEGLTGQTASVGIMGQLASQIGGVVVRAQARVFLSYAWSVQNAVQVAFWADVAALGGSFLPDVLEAAANFGDSLNRQSALSAGGFSPGIVRGVEAEEAILRPAIENIGGKFLGGTVKGIDGQFGIARGDVLIQGKSHDVAPDRLLETITWGMKRLSTVDEVALFGNTSPSVGGGSFTRDAGPAAGKIYAVVVPESNARIIVSPAFIQGLRRAAEETKTIPIIRVVRGWRGTPR